MYEIEFTCFFHFFHTENLQQLADHEMFDKYSEAQYYQ